jgi:hypothetical protein
MRSHLLFFLFLQLGSTLGYGQCEVQTEMSPTGILNERTNQGLIYTNLQKEVFAQMVHDGDDFFLVLISRPFVKQKQEQGGAMLVLTSNDTLVLNLHNQYYVAKDSSINAMYGLESKQVEKLKLHDVAMISADLGLEEKHFILKLHKDLIKQKTLCLLKED